MLTPFDSKFHFHSKHSAHGMAIIAGVLSTRIQYPQTSPVEGLMKIVFGCLYEGGPTILPAIARTNIECIRAKSSKPLEKFIQEFCTFLPEETVESVSANGGLDFEHWSDLAEMVHSSIALGSGDPIKTERLRVLLFGDREDPTDAHKIICQNAVRELYETIFCSGNINPSAELLELVSRYQGTGDESAYDEAAPLLSESEARITEFENSFRTDPNILACIAAYKAEAAKLGIQE